VFHPSIHPRTESPLCFVVSLSATHGHLITYELFVFCQRVSQARRTEEQLLLGLLPGRGQDDAQRGAIVEVWDCCAGVACTKQRKV
jgi:hypothetical protein